MYFPNVLHDKKTIVLTHLTRERLIPGKKKNVVHVFTAASSVIRLSESFSFDYIGVKRFHGFSPRKI